MKYNTNIKNLIITTGVFPYKIRLLKENDYVAFSKMIKDVFSLPPWDEKLTEEEIEEEFLHCTEKGFIIGAFTPDNKLMGLAEFVHELSEEHKPFVALPKREKNSTWYIHGLATDPLYRSNKEEKRQFHVCSHLVEQGLLHCKLVEPHKSNYCYFRISEFGSMSKGLGERQGFVMVLKDGEVATQIIDPTLDDPYRNFMIKDLIHDEEHADYNFMYQGSPKVLSKTY